MASHNHPHLMSERAEEHRDTVVFAVSSVATFLGILVVAIRLDFQSLEFEMRKTITDSSRIYVRAFVVKRFNWDDVFVFIAIVSSDPSHERRV